MKEKYELLKNNIIEINNKISTCSHKWGKPVYEPDLFDGTERWFFTCENCGKKRVTYEKPNNNMELKKITIKRVDKNC